MKLTLPDVCLGDRLRTARLVRRWSIATVACLAQMRPVRLLMLEHDCREPTVLELVQLSEALDVAADWLLQGRVPSGLPGDEARPS